MSLELVINKGGYFPKVEVFKFPGGEMQVKVPRLEDFSPSIQHAEIRAIIKSSDDVMALLLLTDALRRESPNIKISLFMPYVPYARQDRVMVPGEALSISVFCSLINSQGYDSVRILDPHSDVTPALLNKCLVVSQADLAYNCFGGAGRDVSNLILVSPDAGALKKIYSVAKILGITDIIRADKSRDVATGKITGTVVYSENVGSKDFLIVDDIGDGMGSFIPLGLELRKLTTGKIFLFITHGLFSKGIDILHPIFDKVYCPNIMLENWKEKDTHGIMETL